MYLLVKVHVLKAELVQLLVELHTFCHFFEVDDVLEANFDETHSLDHVIAFEPFTEENGSLACELAFFKAQVDDALVLLFDTGK